MALLPSSQRFMRLRERYLREVLAGCGPGLEVSQHVVLKYPERISIGADVFINRGTFVAAHAPISIGDRVGVGPYVIMNSGDHRYGDRSMPIRDQGHNRQPIRLEDDVWIGAHAVILKGTILGQGCVVAAGAVVTRDVPPFAVVAGVPAQVISERPPAPSMSPMDDGLAARHGSRFRPSRLADLEQDQAGVGGQRGARGLVQH